MKFNGKEEALKLIKALSPDEAGRIIETISSSDPKLAVFLKSNLIEISDIQYLTQAMLMHVLREIDLEVFGLAIKSLDQSIINKVMSMVSTGIKLDIEDGLKTGLTSVDKIQEAQTKLLELLNKKQQLGQIILDKGQELV